MRGYGGLDRPGSTPVRFIRNSELDGSEGAIFNDARDRGVRVVYVDLSAESLSKGRPANVLAHALRLDHAPYEQRAWLRFSDDLTTLAYRVPGLVIVVDGADSFLQNNRDDFYDLIEAFVSQVHHWLEQDKPCYLCLQMEANGEIRGIAQADY
jgi:hypothetical protein